jgi:hypothetical protein
LLYGIYYCGVIGTFVKLETTNTICCSLILNFEIEVVENKTDLSKQVVIGKLRCNGEIAFFYKVHLEQKYKVAVIHMQAVGGSNYWLKDQ